jgi:(2Fe-2S) ferredoxin
LSPPARRVGDRQTGVVVCRGCCCGNAERDPGIDHGGQLLRLQRFAQARPAQVLMRTTDCLGPCEQANVVVVRPSAAGRRRGGRPVWLGLVRDEGAVDLIEAWVSAGGPGLAPPPAPLTLHVIPAPKPVRSDRVR